jgi:hypothetical protein
MQFEVIAAYAMANTITSDPSLTIGTSAAGTQIVAAVNLTTALGDLTIKTMSVTPGDTLDVRIVSDAGDKAVDAAITIIGYCSKPPSNIDLRGDEHF